MKITLDLELGQDAIDVYDGLVPEGMKPFIEKMTDLANRELENAINQKYAIDNPVNLTAVEKLNKLKEKK